MLGSCNCRTLYIDYGKRCVVGLQVQSQYHETGPICNTKILFTIFPCCTKISMNSHKPPWTFKRSQVHQTNSVVLRKVLCNINFQNTSIFPASYQCDCRTQSKNQTVIGTHQRRLSLQAGLALMNDALTLCYPLCFIFM